MKITRLLVFFIIMILCSYANAQTLGDSLMIVRSHQYADSILRAINGGHQANAPAAPVHKSADTIYNPQPVSGSIFSTPVVAADSLANLSVRKKHRTDGDSTGHVHTGADSTGKWQGNPDAAAAWQNADSATRAKWKAKRAASDSTGKSGKWQGNTDGSAPQGKPAGGNNGGGAPAGATGGMPSGMGAMIANMKMSIGHIYGKVIDGSTKKPISYVSVSLYTMKDSLVTGQLSEDNGDFSFSDLRAGAYNVKVSFIGYKDLVNKVVITPAKSEQDIGNLIISPDITQLKEVDVTGQRSTVELKVDRKVFNVGNDISARGGTGLDVMKNIPSVSIDADGNVTLRNNTPQVYVDGKPTTLTLEQIPADQIDKVEVITNPSAKYEAASSGGIINVVMKKNTKPGYNGMVNLNIATNTGYNGLAMINLKEKKWGMNLMYTINGATNHTNGFNNRNYLDSLNHVSAYTNQGINSTFKRIFQVGRIGFDFFINNRNTLSISQTAVFGNFNTDDAINITGGVPGTTELTGTQNNNQLNHFRNWTTDMSFKHTYPTEGKEYTLDVQYNHANGGGNYLYTTSYSFTNGNIFPLNPTYENLNGGQHSDQITALADFSLPIGKNMKIETGFRSNYKLTYSYNNVSNDSTLSTGIIGPSDYNYGLSNNYRIDDLVNGVYVTFTHMIKGFSYQLGLRAEEVYYKGTSYQNGDSAFSYQYPTTLSSVPKILFPSFNISQKWGTKHELQFNVARKSNRPNFFQIAPFIFSSNATTVQRGNPNLQPEFINQGEVNYNLALNKFSWLSSVYGRYVQQPITSYLYPEEGNAQIFVSSYANGTHSLTGGWENTMKIYPVKKLDITLSGNVFYTDIVGGAGENNANNEGWSWLAKAIISYKLPMDITIQGNGTYEAPKILPQGKTTPLYYFDLSLSKDFGFFTLNFTVSDVMNTKANGIDYYQASVADPSKETYVPGFAQDQSRRRDQRYAKLGVSFRFGKMDASLFKKKKPSSPDSGGGDMGF